MGFWLTLDFPETSSYYWQNWTSDNRGIKFMSRPPADLRISLKQRGGPTFRIELIRVPFTRRPHAEHEAGQTALAASRPGFAVDFLA